ncbi:MAG TPA: SAM-dependent methyltransferase, partial [Burkholderiales bacterium]|nr:SAM-dependent methyltransferase [Burkholderiales bacterium]
MPRARLRIALSLVSAAALAYEILLTRLFSIVQWHHFAYMMISVALLGYGAAGAFVALQQDRLGRRFDAAFVVCAALFGVSAAGCFLLAQEVPFNALEFLWDPRQPLWLLVVYLLLFLPF